mmetsp:Transcript_16451/g.57498  ORF Transcript_16451/g.57498 Transcript_16451/m.57498 type:complete len:475 (-) Transcript_16451:5193-6617(-)
MARIVPELPWPASSPSSPVMPTALTLPARRNSMSPSSCTLLCRMRQLSECMPSLSAGSSASVAVSAWTLTMTWPARIATSRTMSLSSARPCTIRGRTVPMYGPKASPIERGRNASTHSSPSRDDAAGCVASGSSSVRTSLKRGSPSATMTSLRPCAPPDRSTVDVSACSVSTSHATRSPKCSSPMPLASVPRARDATLRTSGIGSSSVFFSCGTSWFRYGRMSFSSWMSEDMLPTIIAAFDLIADLRAARPRRRIGTISASDGGSMLCTKAVSVSESSASPVRSAGSLSAPSSIGTSSRISGLRITLPTSCSASRPACCTRGCVSPNASHSFGTICGRHDDSWRGAQYAILPRSTMLACLERHWISCRPLSSTGITSLTPWPDSLLMITCAAGGAASRTSRTLSPYALMSSGRMRITYGSKSRPREPHRHSKANSAPWRAPGLLRLLAATSRTSTTLCAFSEPRPRPLTAPARP